MVNWNNLFQFDLEQLRLKNHRTGRQCSLTQNEGLLLQALIDGIEVKQELITEIWTRRHSVVTENSYYQLVSLLRKSFASVDLPDAIVTRARRGVALVRPKPGDLAPGTDKAVECASMPDASMPDTTTSHARDDNLTHRLMPGGPVEPLPPGHPARPFEAGFAFRAGAAFIATGTGVAALVTVTLAAVDPAPSRLPAPESLTAYAGGPVAMPEHSLMVGDSLISYSQMPADTALRVWRDVQTRVTLAPEQTRRIYIAQHRNRYAVLVCSEPLDPLIIRCSTVTVSV